MATSETNGDGRAVNPSGVYRHPDTGNELVFQATAKFGNPGADAAVRLGYVFVGPAKLVEANQDGKKAELVAQTDPTAGPSADTSPNRKTIAQLESELQAAKERQAEVEKAAEGGSDLVEVKSSKKGAK